MSGYHGYSMSNNAVQAYEDGERPISKWKKEDIIGSIEEMDGNGEISLQCSLSALKKLPEGALKEACLSYSSWHHTGKYYNETEFYSLDEERIEDLTDERLKEIQAGYRKRQEELKKEKEQEEEWVCSFLEWTGTRNYPRAKEVTETGIIKGKWFIRYDGSKKSIHARGFRKIRRTDEENREEAAAKFERSLQYNESLVRYGKEKGVKGIRMGLKTATLIRKISEAGYDVPERG